MNKEMIEDTAAIIESRFVEFEERLNNTIEIKINELERSIKKILHNRLNIRFDVSLNIIEKMPEETCAIEDITEDLHTSEDKFEREFQKTTRSFKKEFEKSLAKMLQKHLLVTKFSKKYTINENKLMDPMRIQGLVPDRCPGFWSWFLYLIPHLVLGFVF